MTNTSSQNIENSYQAIYPIDLSFKDEKGEVIPFTVELLTYAIDSMIMSAIDASYVYELFTARSVEGIWKYLWLRPIELPSKIQEKYHNARIGIAKQPNPYLRWPSDQIPFVEFDKLFYDEYEFKFDIEYRTWLCGSSREILKGIAEKCYVHIKHAQMDLRESNDMMVQSKLRLMDAGKHNEDHAFYPPFNQRQSNEKDPNRHKQTKLYYEKLAEVLAMPQIKSVSYSDGSDYQTLHLCCNEKLRREPAPCLLALRDQFRIDAMNNMIYYNGEWGVRIYFHDEGIRCMRIRDLFIHQENDEYGIPFKIFLRDGLESLYILTTKNEGDLVGYEREVNDDWVLYRRVDVSVDLA